MAEKDKQYKYSGPLSGVSLPDGREVALTDGATVSLPPDNAYVKRLVALKRLTEITGFDSAQPTNNRSLSGAEGKIKKEDTANAS